MSFLALSSSPYPNDVVVEPLHELQLAIFVLLELKHEIRPEVFPFAWKFKTSQNDLICARAK